MPVTNEKTLTSVLKPYLILCDDDYRQEETSETCYLIFRGIIRNKEPY